MNSTKPPIHSGGQSAAMIRPPSNGGIGIMLKRFEKRREIGTRKPKPLVVVAPTASRLRRGRGRSAVRPARCRHRASRSSGAAPGGERAQQRNERRQSRRQAVRAKCEVVPQLVRQQEQHDDDCETPPEDNDVDPEREQERPAERQQFQADSNSSLNLSRNATAAAESVPMPRLRRRTGLRVLGEVRRGGCVGGR